MMNDTMILPDLLTTDLDIVFCGTAASKKSASRKAYYAGMGNLFYPALLRHNFTDRLLMPEEFHLLLDYKIGLTDLAKYTFGLDKDLKENDYDITAFENKIRQYTYLQYYSVSKNVVAGGLIYPLSTSLPEATSYSPYLLHEEQNGTAFFVDGVYFEQNADKASIDQSKTAFTERVTNRLRHLLSLVA